MDSSFFYLLRISIFFSTVYTRKRALSVLYTTITEQEPLQQEPEFLLRQCVQKPEPVQLWEQEQELW